MNTRGYYYTRTRKGTVFVGTGKGKGKYTRGLPLLFPKCRNIQHLICPSAFAESNVTGRKHEVMNQIWVEINN